MNKVEMLGHLCGDPETRYTQGDNPMCIARFSLAVNRRFKREGQPDADFFNCTAFGKTGEFIEKYFKKGSAIALVGSLQNDNYTNKDGQKVYGMQIIIDEVDFAGAKASSESGSAEQKAPAAKSDDGFMPVPDVTDELPFM